MAMRAVISDVHANLEALEAVLADIDEQKIEDVICLGDVVGYGPDPAACIDLVRRRCRVTVMGNQDAAVVGQAFGFHRLAREAIDWTREELKPGALSLPARRVRWKWLSELPARHEEEGLLFVHGSPRDPVMEYVEEGDTVDMGFGPSEKILEIFGELAGPCFIGHTHRPGVIGEDYQFRRPEDLPGGEWALAPGLKCLVNVGSVGQPRDENASACYALVGAGAARFRRVTYDVAKTIAKMEKLARLDPRLRRRLEEGR